MIRLCDDSIAEVSVKGKREVKLRTKSASTHSQLRGFALILLTQVLFIDCPIPLGLIGGQLLLVELVEAIDLL
jgi:hypothetical protein